MIAGNAMNREPPAGIGARYKEPDPPKSDWGILNQTTQEWLSWRAIGFNCIHDPGSGIGEEGALLRHYLPSQEEIRNLECDALRSEIAFPSCWDGQSIDSEGHNKHVLYPDLAEDGRCPEGFDIQLPTLVYEAVWNTRAFMDRSGHFLLSNGDATGKLPF